MNNTMDKNLGKQAKDKITGFTGIIIGRIEYLFGCNQYCLAPKAENNSAKESQWYDTGRIEIIGEGVTPGEVTADKPGGVSSIAPKIC